MGESWYATMPPKGDRLATRSAGRSGSIGRARSLGSGYLRGRLRALWRALAALSLVALAAPAGALAGVRVTPRDRAATRAFLQARYAYEQTLAASAPASKAAVETLVSRLGGECSGVLVGAPHRTLSTLFESPGRSPSARRIGESNRESRQRGDLEGELALALELPMIELNRQAALSYAHAVSSLRWSNSALTALERTGGAVLDWQLASLPPDVCADMRAWVASGYKTLSPATKMLIGEREAVVRPLFRILREHGAGLGASDPLLPYEGSHEKALAKKIRRLEREVADAFNSLDVIETRLQITLGLISQAEAEMQIALQTREGRPKGSVEIGHGRTAAGADYTVWFEPKKPGGGSRRAHCQIRVGVYENKAPGNSSGTIEILGGSNEKCLSRSHPKAPRVHCRGGEGLLTIEAQTTPRARSVRLHLSDGRQITSHVAIVSAKLGGPVGFYYQVVRGPSPIPISATEVDVHGKALRTVQLPHTARCVKHSFKRQRRRVHTIVSGSLPQGPSFSIVGERSGAMSKTHFELSVEVAAEEALGGLISSSGSLIAAGEGSRSKPSPFALQRSTGCQPHEYAILYGLLIAPADTVLARSSGSLQPFQRVRIPASLHAHGVLAYIALPSLPSEVLVRTPAGRTLFTEDLARPAREAKETCEGEAEGPG
jgi:hypothetical protein